MRTTIIENIYELKYEELDEKIIDKLKENKYKIKKINKEIIIEKIKEVVLKQEIIQLLKELENNNSIKNSIMMREMYKQGFIDGINLIIECKTTN